MESRILENRRLIGFSVGSLFNSLDKNASLGVRGDFREVSGQQGPGSQAQPNRFRRVHKLDGGYTTNHGKVGDDRRSTAAGMDLDCGNRDRGRPCVAAGAACSLR